MPGDLCKIYIYLHISITGDLCKLYIHLHISIPSDLCKLYINLHISITGDLCKIYFYLHISIPGDLCKIYIYLHISIPGDLFKLYINLHISITGDLCYYFVLWPKQNDVLENSCIGLFHAVFLFTFLEAQVHQMECNVVFSNHYIAIHLIYFLPFEICKKKHCMKKVSLN